MRLVVADTGPINYLVLVDAVDTLPKLFDEIVVPVAVYDELTHAEAPAVVRAWIAQAPAGSKFGRTLIKTPTILAKRL